MDEGDARNGGRTDARRVHTGHSVGDALVTREVEYHLAQQEGLHNVEETFLE